jgi:nucleotide-binding universal stress UspA family protein
VVRHILVPLDGSSLAEAVLPTAATMARAFDARVTLFHVLEEWAPDRVHGQTHLTDGDRAQTYLEGVVRSPLLAGRVVEAHVHRSRTDDVADSLMAHADELEADLVILATHGQGGLRDLFLGSIALRALTRGRTPVLLVNPGPGGAAPPADYRTILVPLDGTPEHEPALPIAARVARALGAALHLVNVVPTAGTLSGHQAAAGALLPMATRALLELAEEEAAVYVKQREVRLVAEGVRATGAVRRGDPLAAIVEAAEAVRADLVVMATHAQGAMGGFWSGSLTPRLMQRLGRPVLLVRAEGHDHAR